MEAFERMLLQARACNLIEDLTLAAGTLEKSLVA